MTYCIVSEYSVNLSKLPFRLVQQYLCITPFLQFYPSEIMCGTLAVPFQATIRIRSHCGCTLGIERLFQRP